MKLVTPKFILREYERLMKAVYNGECCEEREAACQQIDRTRTPYEAMQFLREMIGYLEAVPLKPTLFNKSRVCKDLITALIRHPSRKEAGELLEFIADASRFKCSWSQWDAESEVRYFRKVKNKEQWENLSKKSSAVLFKGEGIKVLYVEVEPKLTKRAERAKKELGEYFWPNYTNWKIWFNQRCESHYYFYFN